MNKSLGLRGQEVQAVYHLVNECRDLGFDAREWYQHLAEGLRSLLSLRACIVGEVGKPNQAPKLWPQLQVASGLDAAAEAVFQRYVESKAVLQDPAWTQSWNCPASQAIFAPEQLAGKRAWLASAVYNEYYRLCHCDFQLLSYHALPGAEARSFLSAWRSADMRRFSRRERRLLSLVHQEIGLLLGGPLATAQEPGLSSLAPRLRQTMEALLEGDSEKQVALRLRVSVNTVHDYIKGLYRHFGVSSRAELLAHFLRRLRGQPPP